MQIFNVTLYGQVLNQLTYAINRDFSNKSPLLADVTGSSTNLCDVMLKHLYTLQTSKLRYYFLSIGLCSPAIYLGPRTSNCFFQERKK